MDHVDQEGDDQASGGGKDTCALDSATPLLRVLHIIQVIKVTTAIRVVTLWFGSLLRRKDGII